MPIGDHLGQQASSAADPAFCRVPAARRRPSPRPAGGFTLVELQISLAILAIGILGLLTLMVRQSKQITRLEAWCVPNPTYYVVGQTDPWMRALGAPAELTPSAGQSAWTPPVSGEKDNLVTLVSFSQPGQTMSAQVTLEPNDPSG
jgi:hypothetical protein